jgi:signal transduction histidine kinase
MTLNFSHWPTSFSIKQKGLLLLLIPFALQLLLIAVIIKTYLDNRTAQNWALHTKDVISQTELSYRTLLEAQSAARGFLLTEDVLYSDSFETAIEQNAIEVGKLATLVKDNPVQTERIHRITQDSKRYHARLAEEFAAVRSGKRDEAIAIMKSLAPKQYIDDVRRSLDAFQKTEEVLNESRKEVLKIENLKSLWILLMTIPINALAFIFAARIFDHSIARRISHIMGNLSHLASATPLLPPLDKHIQDELARLDQAFYSIGHTLQERTRENELFIYSVSHDLRSPLVNLQGFTDELTYSIDALTAAIDGKLTAQADGARIQKLLHSDFPESVRFIKTAVTRLAIIIEALLRLSRAGRVSYEWQMVDLNPIQKRITEALQSSIAKQNVQVDILPLPVVFGDPTALEQIFANLTSNAVKYLDPQRPGKISIGVDWSLSTPDSFVLYVRDNGVGIPKEYMKKLFLAFQRIHPDIPGEGVGLALVRRIVERHGGKIWCDSDINIGTTFYVTLSNTVNKEIISRYDEPVYGSASY